MGAELEHDQDEVWEKARGSQGVRRTEKSVQDAVGGRAVEGVRCDVEPDDRELSSFRGLMRIKLGDVQSA